MCTTEEHIEMCAEAVIPSPCSEEREKQKQYYLEQARQLCPYVPTDATDTDRLDLLHCRLKQNVKALKYFDRTWENGMPQVQRACLYYLTVEKVPPKLRRRALEEWAGWSEFLVGVAHWRSFLGQVLNDSIYQLQELEEFLSGTAPESNDLSNP